MVDPRLVRGAHRPQPLRWAITRATSQAHPRGLTHKAIATEPRRFYPRAMAKRRTPMTQGPPDPCGILVIDKPSGMTSHDVVHRVRKTFGFRKVGHAGTLDPMATGVLILLVGKATRSQDRFLNDDKEYEGELVLGTATSTHDREGEVTDRAETCAAVSRGDFAACLHGFLGPQEQTPPMVSAIKHRGKPLYKYARQGIVIPRKPRPITITSIELLGFDHPRATFRVACSKGTYIRTLAHDLGLRLGTFAHLSALRRTRSGPFSIDRAHALPDVLVSRREEVVHLLELVSDVAPRPS